MPKRSPLAEKLDEVKDRIAAACAKAKREPREVTLIAVTKTAAPEQIRGADVTTRTGVACEGASCVPIPSSPGVSNCEATGRTRPPPRQ